MMSRDLECALMEEIKQVRSLYSKALRWLVFVMVGRRGLQQEATVRLSSRALQQVVQRSTNSGGRCNCASVGWWCPFFAFGLAIINKC